MTKQPHEGSTIRSTRRSLAALALVATVAAACGGSGASTDVGATTTNESSSVAAQDQPVDGDANTAPDTDAASDAPADTPAGDVPPALDFTAETVAGGTFNGADVAGGDVLLWFWAPW